jgi:hypothetical protein
LLCFYLEDKLLRNINKHIYDNIAPGRDPYKSNIYKKDDMREFKHFCRLVDKLVFPRERRYNPYPFKSPSGLKDSSLKQRCVVKLRYGTDIVRHLRFLEEYLSQQNKEEVRDKPKLFGPASDNLGFISEYKDAMTDLHFKFIISPENQNVDGKALVKSLVKRIEAITGHKLYWVAAEHRNTEHRHVHLLINGKDRQGQDVSFDKEFIKQTFREMARQVCTTLIGPRSREEIRNSIDANVLKNRYTVLDKKISEQETFLPETAIIYGSQVMISNRLLTKRLEHLAELDFAKKKQGHSKTWLLERNWKEKLKEMSHYNSYDIARRELAHQCPLGIETFNKETGPIEGWVIHIYRMNDEESWNHAIVVQNRENQRAWYIPLYYEPDEHLLGSHISCAYTKNKQGKLQPTISRSQSYRSF